MSAGRPNPRARAPAVHVRATAWVALYTGYLFWLLGANAFLLLCHAYVHGAVVRDPAHGLTYAMNNHGMVRWIAPADFARFAWGCAVGGGGFAIGIAFTIILAGRAGIVAMIARGAWLVPLVGLAISIAAWAQRG